uniref:Ankyrin repeat domain 44 n=1 Tax=Anser brachyrhynchus TaxID=132585 RepID=A0A8B9C696_9AVES
MLSTKRTEELFTGQRIWIDEMNIYGNTALHIACYNGQDSVVNELIDYGANVNQPNNNGFTPLHFAAASTHGALCLELLVNNGADVNIQSKDGKSPLHMTAVHGRFTRSQTLIQNGGEIDCVDKDGNTPLHVAARYGHELLINTLITSGADTAKCGIHNMFPLHLAALNAHSDCCRKLLSSGQKYSIVSLFSNEHVLSAGFEIDTPDSFGRTCLHAAAAGGNVECIKLLQSSGADFNKKDKCGRTPLHYAAANCHFHCIETLVTTGANINETDDWGRTPLHYAAASDMDRKKNILGNSHENAEELERASEMKEKEAALCLEFLLQNDANPSIQDKEGYNTVHYAAAYGHRQCLELLLEKTNNVFEESDSAATKSPLHLAAYNGHHQALEVLLQSLVDLDIKDEKGRTALDLAAFKGHAECVEALISQGASVTVKDNVTKRTPLHASGECVLIIYSKTDLPESFSDIIVNKLGFLFLLLAEITVLLVFFPHKSLTHQPCRSVYMLCICHYLVVNN